MENPLEPRLEVALESSLPFPSENWARVLYGLFLLCMPVVAFWATDIFKPEWQNGQFHSYLILFLSPSASLAFFPLLAYSVICYLLLLIAPHKYSTYFVIRLGIYTGVLLAVQYSILEGLYFFANDSMVLIQILIWVFPVLASKIYRWAIARWTYGKVNIFVVAILGLLTLLSVVISRQLSSPLLLLLIGLTFASPFWSLLIALRSTGWLFKNYETGLTLPRGLGVSAWLAGYAVAWRYDILKMYELYAALPPQPPPDCYIATAAAKGHPQFVRSHPVLRSDSAIMYVNTQLRIMKLAELALLVVTPGMHKLLRRVYDVVGQYLASQIQNPYLADGAYLLLKPFEWLANLALSLIIGNVKPYANLIYTK